MTFEITIAALIFIVLLSFICLFINALMFIFSILMFDYQGSFSFTTTLFLVLNARKKDDKTRKIAKYRRRTLIYSLIFLISLLITAILLKLHPLS